MKYGAEETGGSSSGFAATALLPSLLEPRAISSSPVAVALRESQDESALLELVPASRAADVPDPAGSTSPVFGRVLDDLSGAPIPGTRIILDGTDVAVAGSTGVFEFSSVPVGRHSIRVEQLGYEVLDTDITLVEGPGIFLDVTLGVRPIELDPIVVFALPRRGLIDLYDLRHRVRLGFGSFVTAEEISVRGSPPMSSLVRTLPSIRMIGGTQPVFRDAFSFGQGWCSPTFYLDGMKVGSFDGIKRVETMDVALIEGYAGAASVPGEFSGSDARCGVIAVWTDRGAGLPLSSLIEAWKKGGVEISIAIQITRLAARDLGGQTGPAAEFQSR